MKTLKITLTITVICVTVFAFSASAQTQKPQAPKPKTASKENIYTVVEKSPSFPGGNEKLYSFLSKNITYPAADRNANVQGKVFVSFVVEPDGSLTNVVAVRGPSETLKAEAVKVVANSPKWQPGMQGGKKVRVQYVLPISFTLQRS